MQQVPSRVPRELAAAGNIAGVGHPGQARFVASASTTRGQPAGRLVQHAYNAAFYRTRHMVENSYSRLSLRPDKTEAIFQVFACFAAALMNMELKIRLCS